MIPATVASNEDLAFVRYTYNTEYSYCSTPFSVQNVHCVYRDDRCSRESAVMKVVYKHEQTCHRKRTVSVDVNRI